MRVTTSYVASLNKCEIEELTESMLVKVLRLCDKHYYNKSTSIICDGMYDDIKERLMLVNPSNYSLNAVGCKISDNVSNKVQIPYWMGSMNKIKEDDNDMLHRWLLKHGSNVIVSDKLDGISCLLIKSNGSFKLCTRGDGTTGTDISFILPHIKFIPDMMIDFCVRGELIITKNDYTELVESGILSETSNSRNVVSGACMSTKDPNINVLQKIQIVAYEFIGYDGGGGGGTGGSIMMDSPQNQFIELEKIGICKAYYTKYNDISIELLKKILTERKRLSGFNIDGIVIYSNSPYVRNVCGNPTNAFAFKMKTEEVQATVKDVIWHISKDKYLKPVVVCLPVYLGGVTIHKATGICAKFIVDNQIGQGAIVMITRSGDVIPKITKVIVPTKHVTLPNVPYEWTSTGVDIVLIGENEDYTYKKFEYTVQSLDIKGLKSGMIKIVYTHGIRNLKSLFSTTKSDFLKFDGIKETSANNLISSINMTLNTLTLQKVMVSSNILGRGIGEKTIKSIFTHCPDIMKGDYGVKDLISINGIELKTAQLFLSNIPKFKEYLRDNDLEYLISSSPKILLNDEMEYETSKFSGMCFVFSGIRSLRLREIISKNGGTVHDNITSQTTHLISNSNSSRNITTKMKKAVDCGLTIIDINDSMFT